MLGFRLWCDVEEVLRLLRDEAQREVLAGLSLYTGFPFQTRLFSVSLFFFLSAICCDMMQVGSVTGTFPYLVSQPLKVRE